MKKLWLPLAAGMVCCACSSYELKEVGGEGAAVTVSVNAAPWKGTVQKVSRAGDEMLSPVTLLAGRR